VGPGRPSEHIGTGGMSLTHVWPTPQLERDVQLERSKFAAVTLQVDFQVLEQLEQDTPS
jgi:hypothetical protein